MEKSVFGMLAKHLASVAEMCAFPTNFDIGKWMEKLTDSINYLLILSAVVNRNEKPESLGAAARALGEALRYE